MSHRVLMTLPVAKFLLCIGIVVYAASPAEAQSGQALPVGVSFEFTAPEIIDSFDDDAQRKQLEQQITTQFNSRLQSRFHYWTFAPVSSTMRVTLKLGLKKTDAVILWVRLLNGPNELARWEEVVYPPGDLIRLGMPTGDQWVKKLPPVLDGLLQKQNQEVLAKMKAAAPVGKEIRLMQSAADPDMLPRAVLALDSSQYADLLECKFKLRYDWTQGGQVTIHSSGISMHVPFAAAAPPFDGIVVQLEEWQQGDDTRKIETMRTHLKEITPVEFYLDVIKGPGTD